MGWPREQVLNVPITCWYIDRVSWCSCVTTWLKPISPMLRWSWGRKDEVIRGDGWANLFAVAMISSSVGDCFDLMETKQKVATRWPREIRMVWDHMRTERGMCVACWSGFPCRVYIDSNHHDPRIWVPLCLWLSAHSWLMKCYLLMNHDYALL
jgi:hypothetical protein